VDSVWRRQGYTFEAATALSKWGLSQRGVKAITADCLKSNTASRNLLRKLGMKEIKQDDELIYFRLTSRNYKYKGDKKMKTASEIQNL